MRHPCPHPSPRYAGHHPEPHGAAGLEPQTHRDPRGEVGAPRVTGLQVGARRLTAIHLGAPSNSPIRVDNLNDRTIGQARVDSPDPGAAAYLQGPGTDPARRVGTDVQSQIDVLELGESAGHRDPFQKARLGAQSPRLKDQGKAVQVLKPPADQILKLLGTGRIVSREEPQHEPIEQRGRVPKRVLSGRKHPLRRATESADEVRPLPVSALSQTNKVPVQASGNQAPTHRRRCARGHLRQDPHLCQEGGGLGVRTRATSHRSDTPGVDLLIKHVDACRSEEHREGPGRQRHR